MDLAATAPRSVQAVAKIRGLGNQKSDWLAKQLVSLIEQADSVPKNEWPEVAEKKSKERAPAAVLEMLRVLLKHVCDEAKIAPRLIASAQDLERLALSDDRSQPILQGWRFDVFGKQALAMKKGKIAMALEKGAIRFIDIP